MTTYMNAIKSMMERMTVEIANFTMRQNQLEGQHEKAFAELKDSIDEVRRYDRGKNQEEVHDIGGGNKEIYTLSGNPMAWSPHVAGLPTIEQYSPDCPVQLKKSLFLVGHIGGNDINYGLSQGKIMEELRRLVPDVVQTITHSVKRVIDFGATRIVVPGNFPKGCGQAFLTQFMTNDSSAYDEYHCLKHLNNLVIFYNDHLQQAILR
ncbi:hypothetical protein H5410_004096 [Solanum commersonii]|uniref:Uncharacterized protein n=1 Tax=Solanum commersonii TaxID=4109 RepID=A0A9J6B6Z6_SOLCO|nr:hypothetical protein H5410_004096 [Solanum commersonii]